MSTAQPTFDDILRLFQETDRKFQETDHRRQETDRSINEIDRQLQENARLIQKLGAKFGSFTEGLALPSMEKILRDRFGMEVISPSVRVSKAGQHLEIDVLAYANGPVNTAYVVEVKSHAREESIAQLKTWVPLALHPTYKFRLDRPLLPGTNPDHSGHQCRLPEVYLMS